jgi:hypothetical protein
MECVSCEVGTKFLNIVESKFVLQMAATLISSGSTLRDITNE